MTEVPRGGRGQRAPYETTTVRVPKPILSDVEQLIGQYRAQVLGGENMVSDQKLDLEAAIIKSQELLGDKKASKKVTIKKLLEAIYGQQIKLENL
jgi:hypothetical protein